MGTRGMIAVREREEGPYSLFYRHHDSYPEGLGAELIREMKVLVGKRVEDVLKSVAAQPERRIVNKPEDAFLHVQGDLEWVYAIDDLDEGGRIKSTTSIEIFRTSSPYFFSEQGKKRDFVFRVWASRVEYFPHNYEEWMSHVSTMTAIVLECLSAFIDASS